jgi:hypothetical protein
MAPLKCPEAGDMPSKWDDRSLEKMFTPVFRSIAMEFSKARTGFNEIF